MNIEIKNVSFSYRDTDKEKPVLMGCNLSFSDEQPTVLLAPSGAGKTTLIRLLLGLSAPDEGEITGISKDTKMSVVFQEDRLFETMNVYENWRIVCPELSREEAAGLARDLGLDPQVLEDRPASLSGGMRRRVAVGRALCYDAPVVIMDEPFQGLDEATRSQVIGTVKERCRGKALLIVTHDPADASKLGARVETLG